MTFSSTQGRFNIAAKHHMVIAELYENGESDVEKVSSVDEACCYCDAMVHSSITDHFL